jgi:moderate conductance mechanosensitive channel
MPNKRFFRWTIGCIIAIKLLLITPAAVAQFPSIQDLLFQSKDLENSLIERRAQNILTSECLILDGRCLFKIAFQPEISDRINDVQSRLNNISEDYLKKESDTIRVTKQRKGDSIDLYITIGDERDDDGTRLLTVTKDDADLDFMSIDTKADRLAEALRTGFKRAKQERLGQFIERQALIAAAIFVFMFLSSWIVFRWNKNCRQAKKNLSPSDNQTYLPISKTLDRRQKWNIQEIQLRLLQLAQIVIWGGGFLFILGLFPHTRTIQFAIILSLRIPLRVTFVLLITYVLIRLSYALIARFNSAFIVSSYLINRREHRRLQLRVTTISRISRSVITIIWVAFGFVITLSAVGVNIAPLLAGAGIVGVAISLASQNLIKDAINGFFIILEDQYAVGDVINVGEVSGLVENMNLRITQLRDGEGRLITIPNSEIKIVANLSSQWSRADLNIPVAYQADIDKAIELLVQIAEEMSQEPIWRDNIIEPPEVLGIDNFADRGIIIKVWIKTEPLKQWDVSREFRRRIKIAFDRAGIPIPIPQQQIWFDSNSKQHLDLNNLKS